MRRVRAQVPEYGEYAAVVVGGLLQSQLSEDLSYVRLDRLRAQEQRLTDRPVRASFGDESEHLVLALGQFVERPLLARAFHEPGDDRRVDDALPLVYSLEGIREHGDV